MTVIPIKPKHVDKLKSQRSNLESVFDRDVSSSEARALQDSIKSIDYRIDRLSSTIRSLSEMTTKDELRRARRVSAVRVGKDVYLPACAPGRTPFPNIVLRAALFSIRDLGWKTPAAQQPYDTSSPDIPTYLSSTTLRANASALSSYDRRVLRACFDYYKERPLAGPDAGWVELSFHNFASEFLGVQPSAQTHRAVLSALRRFDTFECRARLGERDTQVLRLLEVNLDATRSDAVQARGSDRFRFRVPQDVAELFYANEWTGVPHDALALPPGLKSWLAGFYTTHGSTYAIQLETLRRLSGSTDKLNVFESKCKDALAALSAESTPDSIRVSNWSIEDERMRVSLHSWPA